MKDTDIYRGPSAGWQAVSAIPGCSMKLAGVLPVIFLTMICGANALAQTLTDTEVAQLLATNGADFDRFGASVALDGDTLLIGARLVDDNGMDSGAAYVFTLEGGTWTEQQKLIALDGALEDQFGRSVALKGDIAVIGAPRDDDDGEDSGSAYVFAFGEGAWTQKKKLTASDGAADAEFGTSVAVDLAGGFATDGDIVMIGAPRDDAAGDKSGSVYVFIFGEGDWVEQPKLTASDGATGDRFGQSVAVDGNTAVIGAPRDDDVGQNSGSAYVLTLAEGQWTEQKLIAGDGAADDEFGVSVAVDGNTVLIGAELGDGNAAKSGSAYVFAQEEDWAQQAKLSASDGATEDFFGASAALDGDTAVIGAPFVGDGNGNVEDAGAAYVFIRDGMSTWTEQFKLIASDSAEFDSLGDTGAVAISGPTVVAGADQFGPVGFETGAAYVFKLVGDTDGDGIRDDVDTSPLVFSEDFSDVPNGGMTDGLITTRGDHQYVRVEDSPFGPPNDGVLVTFSGSVSGPVPARVHACTPRVTESSTVFASVAVTCGSAIVEVISGGPVEFTFTANDGTESTTVLVAGDAVEFDNVLGSFTVATPVQITIDGTPFNLEPGSAVSLMPVTVVIKPGSAVPRINRCSNGVTTVALLGSAMFDVRVLDPDSLAFGDVDYTITEGIPPTRVKFNEDVNGDGFLDAVLQFKTSELYEAGMLQHEQPLYVTGELTDGTMVRGFDEVYWANQRPCK